MNSNSGWVKAWPYQKLESELPIAFSLSDHGLQFSTDKEDFGDNVQIYFLEQGGSNAFSLAVDLHAKTFTLTDGNDCIKDSTDLPIWPSGVKKVWTFYRTAGSIVLECNDQIVMLYEWGDDENCRQVLQRGVESARLGGGDSATQSVLAVS